MSTLLAHQFIVYVTVIEYYEDYESNVSYSEYFYSVEEDAKTCLEQMMYNEGGAWAKDAHGVFTHSGNNMIAYIRHQVVNGPKLGV